jgi:predicted nucleic acid-binding protein
MKYYFDTCIWIDYLNERNEYVVQKVFEILLNHSVLISELVLIELRRYVDNVMLLDFKNIVLVSASDTQRKLASDISEARQIPFGDALHAVLARDNDAILLTRDKHFIELRDVTVIELL